MIAGGRGFQQLCSLSDSPGGTDLSSNQETYQPGEPEVGSGSSETQDGFLQPGQRTRFKCRTDRRPCLCHYAPNCKLCRRKRQVSLRDQVLSDKKHIHFVFFFEQKCFDNKVYFHKKFVILVDPLLNEGYVLFPTVA